MSTIEATHGWLQSTLSADQTQRRAAEEALKQATEVLEKREAEFLDAKAERDALDFKKAAAVTKRTGLPVSSTPNFFSTQAAHAWSRQGAIVSP